MITPHLIDPHGGALVNRVAPLDQRNEALESASALASVQLTSVQYSDLICLATGVFSPLTGFVGPRDYESILERMRLTDGTVWSIPVTLAVSEDEARRVKEGTAIALK